jgi:lipoprotein NlpI
MVLILSFDEAFADATCALELEPANVKARYRRGLAAFRLGRLAIAQTDAEKCVAADPKCAVFIALLADVRKVYARNIEKNVRKSS